MATTVARGFDEFLTRLTPLSSETERAKSHRAFIEARLKQEFEITRFFRTGSFGNGTSIRGFSDVDYFASIPPAHQRQNSATMLKVVRDALDDRFPRTGVHVDSPAVVVPFGTDISETTEVIPAYFVSKDRAGNHTYHIADGAGGWLQTSPDVHNAYVAAINDKHNRRVKPLIRFLKAWAHYRKVPISSFYLEMRAAKYADGESSIVYSYDVKRVLKMLWDNQLAAMQDPKGISGYIQPCASKADKTSALDELETALDRAQKAVGAEVDGRHETAFYWWDRVFAGHFPAYS